MSRMQSSSKSKPRLEIRATPGVMCRSLGLEGGNQTPGGKRRVWQQRTRARILCVYLILSLPSPRPSTVFQLHHPYLLLTPTLLLSKNGSVSTARTHTDIPVLMLSSMHSKGKGMSASALPYRRSQPSWSKATPEEVCDQIFKLARRGLSPSQIGVILRDSQGIPQVKSVTGNKILRILKTNGKSCFCALTGRSAECAGELKGYGEKA